MAEKHICVAIYATYDQADEAFARLQTSNSDMGQLSFVGRDYWKNMLGSRNAGPQFHYRGNLGAFWQRLWAVLPGWGVFWFFEDGPVLIAGPLVRTIVATQEESNDNDCLKGLGAGLSGIGIPQESLVQYDTALMNQQVLVFIQGTVNDIERAQKILNETKVINHTIHHNNAYYGGS